MRAVGRDERLRRNCNSASRRKRLRRRGWEAEKVVQAQRPEPEGGREEGGAQRGRLTLNRKKLTELRQELF